MNSILIEAVGWIGAICVLGAYILLTTGKLSEKSSHFHILNMIGALGFVINAYAHGAIPSMVLNVIWAGVGGYALIKIAHSSKLPPNRES